MFFKILFTIAIAQKVSSLYEDQIGKFDWKLNHLGKLKFSSIETLKKVYVATDENVIAGLSVKTGEILWRQILEKGEHGKIQFMHVEGGQHTDMVTVTGNGPYLVRGWNANYGNMLYEWSIPTARWSEVHWVIAQDKLFMASIGTHQAEVSVFKVRAGGQPAVHSLSMPLVPDRHSIVVAGQNLLYLDEKGEQLVSVSVLGKSQASILNLGSQYPSTLSSVVSVSDLPYVRVNNKLVAVSPDNLTLLDTEVPASSSVAVHSHSADQNIIIFTETVDNEFKMSAKILETSTPIPELTVQLAHTYPLAKCDINRVTCMKRSDMKTVCRLLLSGADHSVLFIQAPGSVLWAREEALTSIVSLELVDLPVSDIEVAIEKEFNNKEGSCMAMFIRRITSQLLQLQSFATNMFGVKDPISGRADLIRDDFGLHKMIVAVTSIGKIFGIDNLSHEIIWQFTIEDVIPFNNIGKAHVPLFLQRTTRFYPYPAQCIVLYRHKITKETVLLAFNPINGKPTDGGPIRLGYQVQQVVQLSLLDDQFFKGVLLLDTTGKVHVYPKSSERTAAELVHSTYLYTADTAQGQLTGYSLTYNSNKEFIAVPIWDIKLFARITSLVGKSPVERVHSQGRVLGDRSVLYKYNNPNLVVVLTQVEDPQYKNVLSVYLIDVVSGAIVFSVVHKRTLEPIHVVHSENWVIYSYFSDKSRRTEVNAFDLYEGNAQSNTTAFSSITKPIVPLVERQSYILPASIEVMKETITEKGITSKHILLALDNGAVMEMPWMLLDPRRPSSTSPELREEGVIPYTPELPIVPENIINYNQTMLRVKGIHTAASGLESTCLVTVYGLDIFYTRVAPSKTFDMLKEDFDYFFITVVLVGMIISAFLAKRFAAKKALKQAWK